MRAFVFAITIGFHFTILRGLNFPDHFYSIVAIIIAGILIGGIIFFGPNKEKLTRREISWGVFFGSITSLILLFGFLIWLSHAMH